MNFSLARPGRAIEIIIFHRGVRNSKHPSDGMKIQELSIHIITVDFAGHAGGRAREREQASKRAPRPRPQFYQDIKNDRFAAVRSQTAIKLSIKVIYRVIVDPVFIYTPAIAIFCQWSLTQKVRRANKMQEGGEKTEESGREEERSVPFLMSPIFPSFFLTSSFLVSLEQP